MPAELCPLSDVTEAGKEVIYEHQGKRWYLMLFRHVDTVLGYHNVCPHQGRSLNYAPDRFLFDPVGRLVCPHHGALFEVESGWCVQGPCQGVSLRPIKLSVQGDRVLLADGQLLAN